MFVEILVLDADHRFLENIGDLLDRQVVGILFRQRLRDQRAVCGIDLACLRRHEGFLRGFVHQPIRLILHRFYSSVVSAEIECGQHCQDAREHEQQKHFQKDQKRISFLFCITSFFSHRFLRSI